MRDGFYRYHPIVNFTFFALVILFSMFSMHPVCLVISSVSGFLYSMRLNGKRKAGNSLLYFFIIALFSMVINPLFNHEGISILAYFPDGNPLTLESIYYGLAIAFMIFCVLCWFSCYNAIMTNDKFIYLFGKIIPSLSLVLSMTLRFVPNFKAQLKKVSDAQKSIGKGVGNQKGLTGVKNAARIMSVMITWALESAIETADSMKSRGYGLKKRNAFGIFKFDKRDLKVLLFILICGVYTAVGFLLGAVEFVYFPYMKISFSLYGISVFVSYAMICFAPIIIEIAEERRWTAIQSKI